MNALASPRPDQGPPGHAIVWAAPIGVLSLIGFALLYTMNPVLLVLGLTWVLLAALGRRLLGLAGTFLFATLAAPFALWGFAEALVATEQWFEEELPPTLGGAPRNEFGFTSIHPPPMVRLPRIDGWFDFAATDRRPETLAMTIAEREKLSGDVLISSGDFERSDWDRRRLRCDLRCTELLLSTAVQSVTIEPEAEVWLRGPRALMPGYLPQPLSFALRDVPSCLASWHRDYMEGAVLPEGSPRIHRYQLQQFNDHCIRVSVPAPDARYTATLS